MLGRKVIPVAWAGFAPALSADSECRFGRPMRQTGRFVRQTYHRVCRIARPVHQTTCLVRQNDRPPALCAGLAARCSRPSASDARFFRQPVWCAKLPARFTKPLALCVKPAVLCARPPTRRQNDRLPADAPDRQLDAPNRLSDVPDRPAVKPIDYPR